MKSKLLRNSNSSSNNNNNNNNSSNGMKNVTANDLKLLFNSYNYKRTECGILPTKYDIFSRFSKYKEIMNSYMNELDENTSSPRDLNPILIYFIIWNGFFTLFRKFEFAGRGRAGRFKDGYGFDFKLFYEYLAPKNKRVALWDTKPVNTKGTGDDKKTADKKNEDTFEEKEEDGVTMDKVREQCHDYLIERLASTGVFGDYISEWNFRDFVGKARKQATANKEKCEEAKQEVVANFFDGDREVIEKLVSYCLQDIDDIKPYLESTKTSSLKRHVPVSTFVINRYELFHI